MSLNASSCLHTSCKLVLGIRDLTSWYSTFFFFFFFAKALHRHYCVRSNVCFSVPLFLLLY